jgi:hypothetical protein
VLAPSLGLSYVVGWCETVSLEQGAAPVVHMSWLMPIVIGAIFAVVQLFEDYESSLARLYAKAFHTPDLKRLAVVVWHGLWGLALGFVVSMFFFAILIGAQGNYSIPFLMEVSASGATITGTTAIISLFTLCGVAYGAWLASREKAFKPRRA